MYPLIQIPSPIQKATLETALALFLPEFSNLIFLPILKVTEERKEA